MPKGIYLHKKNQGFQLGHNGFRKKYKEKTQICCRCKRELPLTSKYFWKDITRPSGFRNCCKECLGRSFRSQGEKLRPRKQVMVKKQKADFDVAPYKDVEVIQIFEKLYLEDALPFNEIRKRTGLSVGNIHFLLEILGIKLNKKQLAELRRKKREEYYDTLKPSKEELEKLYKDVGYSVGGLWRKHFHKMPYMTINRWFKEYKIPRRWMIRYQSPQERLEKIIERLKSKRIK